MLQVLHTRILADERERTIRRQLRERSTRREAEAAIAEASARSTAREHRSEGSDRLCPDCPCRVAAPAR